MKLQVQQALATILNIQLAPPEQGPDGKIVRHFVRSDDPAQISLGVYGEKTLAQAVWKAMKLADMEGDSHYAIFPIGSNREDFYMSIERELLRQEAMPDFEGKKMWERLGADPRELVTNIMMQLRECATSVVSPQVFQLAMLRTGCLVIASLQWIDDWIGRLKIRDAALKVDRPQPPKSMPNPLPSDTPAEAVQPLFGESGLHVVDEQEVAEKAQEENE